MTIKSAILLAIAAMTIGIATTASIGHAQSFEPKRIQPIPSRQCYGLPYMQGSSGEHGFSCIFAYGDGTKCVWAVMPARTPGGSPAATLQCELSSKPLPEPLPER